MKTKPFSELRKKMTPEQRMQNEIRAKLALLHLNLIELQESLGINEDDLAKHSSAVHSALSELENEGDIGVSTLSQYIKALGGNLKLVAHFPDKEVIISQFE